MHRPVALVEVLRAERADVPLRADELPARRADSLEARAACRAEDEFLLYAFLARRTHHPLLGLGKEALFGELALVRLAEGLLGADDEIQEEVEESARTGFSAPSRSRAGTWKRRPTGWERRRAANVPGPPASGSSRSNARAGCSTSRRSTRCAHGRRCKPLRLPRARAPAST